MDFFDEAILSALKHGKSKSLAVLLDEIGFSHNTLQKHLEHLVAKGLVARKKDAGNFGRPRFIYNIPVRTIKQVNAALDDPRVELVTIAFSRLRHVCRFEKGGFCKETKKDCAPQICPQIRK